MDISRVSNQITSRAFAILNELVLTSPLLAFFTFLRANLVLPPSAMSSNVSTPYLEPTSSQTLTQPPISPLPSDPPRGTASDGDIPPLSLDVLTKKDDKVAALKLVADSIAQQRQQASLSLIFHPLCLAVLGVALAIAYQFAWVRRQRDLGLTVAMCCGVVMTYLLAVRYVASPYLQVAEGLGWDWLSAAEGGGSPEEDLIIGTHFNGELIGALVLRLEPGPSTVSTSRKRNSHSRSPSLKGGKGVIRAWTTRLRYRRKGVGGDMLQEAVKVTRERCGRDAEVGFAKEHANSAVVLPDMFNGPFRRNEVKAAKALEAVLADLDRNKRKR